MMIREIKSGDIPDFIRIAGQLGYEVEKSHIEEHITDKNENEIVFVTEDKDRVIGWIDCRISCSCLSGPYGEILGFVVDENERSRGVGRQMLMRAEQWMREKGVIYLNVHSNTKRERAHLFYQSNGYRLIKKSILFRKDI